VTDEQVWDHGFSAELGNFVGQKGCLIVTSNEQPGPMDGNGRDQIGVGDQLWVSSGHPSTEQSNGVCTITVLEHQDQSPAAVIVDNGGAGAIVNRLSPEARPANLLFSHVQLERHTARRAQGLIDETDPRPTRGTQRARGFDQNLTAEALRRQHQIQDAVPQALEAVAHG
jgi:hypothetical protein